MSDNRGGYRRPSNPAPASGPGRLSRRTDGRQPSMTLPDAKYGEQQAFQNAQQAAPMAADAGGMGAQAGAPAQAPELSNIIPFGAPTQNPDQPITAGLPMGPGEGSINQPQPPSLSPEQAARLRSYIPTLVLLASQPDASPATKQYVRQLRADLG